MSFWRTFGFHTASPIENILDREQFTLEDLLEEEDILTETKAQNRKLLDFLLKPETLGKLFHYITKEPEESDDTKRRFKYPFLSCEILCSEVWSICEAIYQNPALLDSLYGFLDHEAPLNGLLASYVSRVAGVLLQRKPAETIEYLKKKDDIVSKFIRHTGSAAVMDLLLKVIAAEDNSEGVLKWLCEANLVRRLVEQFNPALDAEVHENAAQALADIIAAAAVGGAAGGAGSPLIAQLSSEDAVRALFQFVLSENSSSTLLHGMTVVIELLKRHQQAAFTPAPTAAAGDAAAATTTTTAAAGAGAAGAEGLPPLIKVCLENVDRFKSILATPANAQKVASTVGPMVPLGFTRLKVVEFVLALIKTNNGYVHQVIVSSELLQTCLRLFFEFYWNNFLHSLVEQMINTILSGENQTFKLALVGPPCNLPEMLIEAARGNDEDLTKPKGIRRGYMGYVTSISVTLINIAASNDAINQLLEGSATWKDYVKTTLEAARAVENQTLGGQRPAEDRSGSDEDGGDYERTPTELVFSQYLATQGFGGNYSEVNYDEEDYEDDDGEIPTEGDGDFDPQNSYPNESHRPENDDDDDDDDDGSGGAAGSGSGGEHAAGGAAAGGAEAHGAEAADDDMIVHSDVGSPSTNPTEGITKEAAAAAAAPADAAATPAADAPAADASSSSPSSADASESAAPAS